MRITLALPLLLLVGIAGCYTMPQARDQAPAPPPEPIDLTLFFTEDGLYVERFDSNGDGRTDTFRYFQVIDRDGAVIADPASLPIQRISAGRDPVIALRNTDGISSTYATRLVRAAFDLNHDGEPDLVRYYNMQGQLVREQSDPTFSGALSTTTYFDQGVRQRVDIDSSGDGQADTVRHYRNGQLAFITYDTTGDGQPNLWHYYHGSSLVRVGYDDDGDGSIDRWDVLQRTGERSALSAQRRGEEGSEESQDEAPAPEAD